MEGIDVYTERQRATVNLAVCAAAFVERDLGPNHRQDIADYPEYLTLISAVRRWKGVLPDATPE